MNEIKESEKWKVPCPFCNSEYNDQDFEFKREDGKITRKHMNCKCLKW